MEKFMCPYCFTEHTVKDCKVICTTKNCPKGYKDEVGNVNPDTVDYCLNKCRDAGMNLYCSDDAVMTRYENFVRKYQLDAGTGFKLNIPREIRNGEKTFTIAIVGGPASGKSNYLAVLINQLDTLFTESFKSSFSFLNDATNAIYTQRYYNPIYANKTVPEKTNANEAIPPMMYKMKMPNPLVGFLNRSVNFVFYDVAGEDLAGQGKMQEKGYIAKADLIILLLDPNQMRGVGDENNKNASPTAMLTNIANLITSQRNINIGKIRTPIAVCMSKVDRLEGLSVFEGDDSPVLHESSHIRERGFSKADFNTTNIIMDEVFANIASPNPVTLLKNNFRNYALFGVSALGEDPEGTTIAHLNSYRVLDPLLWFLNSQGYVKTLPEAKKD